ncbi:MAG: ABC transporter ATP-binding protein/permease [Lachnospiraceae bacterium]|nr:ABC transporter ATP-binding protein/permease [Lachnospiraceae bacterium]
MKALKDIIKKLDYILNAKQKRQYFLVMAIALIGSFWELLGVSAVFPFIESLMQPDKVSKAWYYPLLVKYFGVQASDTLQIITILGIILILIYVVKNVYLCGSAYLQSWYSTSVQRDISIKMEKAYLGSSYVFHLGVNSALLLRSIMQDAAGVFAVFVHIFRIFAEGFTVIVITLFLITLDPVIALSLAALLGSCMLIVFFGLKGLVKKFGKIGTEYDMKMYKYLNEAFNGIKEIMVMNRREYFSKNYEEASVISTRAGRRNGFLNSIPTYIYEVACIGGLIGVVILRINSSEDIASVITKVAVIAASSFKLFPSVGRLTNALNQVIYHRPRLDATYDMLKLIEENADYHVKKIDSTNDVPLTFEKELKIDDVCMKYPEGEENVLDHLSLTVKKGESVALIGPSGAGKTTLADVILGLLKPQSGHVLTDGKDVYENLPRWAKIIGYVPQSVYLTDDTIRNNVAFGIYEDQIDEDKVWHALEQAQLADFVKSLPEGLDTMAGERGVRLSGGQRQRIAIARALYEDPPILVLDEATSALDTETETAVMESIDSLHGQKTMIIVAHRLSTIRNCDAVFQVNAGKATKRDKDEVMKEALPK